MGGGGACKCYTLVGALHARGGIVRREAFVACVHAPIDLEDFEREARHLLMAHIQHVAEGV